MSGTLVFKQESAIKTTVLERFQEIMQDSRDVMTNALKLGVAHLFIHDHRLKHGAFSHDELDHSMNESHQLPTRARKP